MPVLNPSKTVSPAEINCSGTAKVTLQFEAVPLLMTEPADMVLVMDRSKSLSGAPLSQAKIAAKQLIQTVALASGSTDGNTISGGSRMGLVSFQSTAQQVVPLSTDTAALDAGISSLVSEGLTNHKEAFEAAQQMLSGSAAGRKVIILFTDGITTAGGDAAPAAEAIRQEGTEIYCIGLGTDAAPLNLWATDPDATHVASADQTAQLQAAFEKIAAEAVRAGALDMVIRESLNPDFKISQVGTPSHGTVTLIDPQTFLWTADAVGAAGAETASVTFDITHIGTTAGIKAVNDTLSYTDREGAVLQFPNPEITLSCSGTVIYPEPCPLASAFLVDSCKDAAVIQANNAVLTGLGRIIQADVLVKNVCPGKQTAVAIILTELDSEDTEHARGSKTVLIPPQPGDVCQDILLKCVSFVVPEALDPVGDPHSLCNSRGFRIRVLANYTDTDFRCCDPQTVIL